MQITVCDRGCGKTSLDSDAAIEKISIRMSQNGDEPMPEMSIIACAPCRMALRAEVTALFTPKKIHIRVREEAQLRG